MSGVATAAVGSAVVGGYMSKQAGEAAASAGLEGSRLSAAQQQQALEYQQEVDKMPLQYRNQALEGLAGVYMGDQDEQQAMIDRAMSSPLYASLMGTKGAGQEAVLQNQAMQGGWRSGDAKMNMMDYTTQFDKNALLTSYGDQLQGLQSFTNPNLNTGGIADTYGDIGATLGGGVAAAGQSRQQGQQGAMNAYTQGIGTAIPAIADYMKPEITGDPVMLASDIRLKDNIRHIGERNGHNWYSWNWNDLAKEKYGIVGDSEGVMAHEVFETNPEAIAMLNGSLLVNYTALGVL